MARAKTKTDGTAKVLKTIFDIDGIDKFAAALINNNFSISKACKELGVTRNAYYYNLKWNEAFRERLNWSNNFLKNIVTNSLLEGITDEDLGTKAKFLSILAKSGVLVKLMGFDDAKPLGDNEGVTITVNQNELLT